MTTAVYKTAVEVNDAMLRVYNYMFMAILISGIVSYFVGNSADLLQFFFTGWIKWVVIFSPLAAVIGIGFALAANPPRELALLMLAGFSALMGLSFAMIFAVFTLGSIVMAFMSAAVLFGTMSLYGYFTRRDLTSIGQFLFVGLIAVEALINVVAIITEDASRGRSLALWASRASTKTHQAFDNKNDAEIRVGSLAFAMPTASVQSDRFHP